MTSSPEQKIGESIPKMKTGIPGFDDISQGGLPEGRATLLAGTSGSCKTIIALKIMNVTTLITAERTEEYGDIARFGVEQFVADNVIIVRNILEAEKRRRTIEILISGATGTGKTLLGTTFLSNGCMNNEKVLVFAFEESRAQLLRNAIGWNMDFRKWEEEGLLKVICNYPESVGIADHLRIMKQEIEDFAPDRIVLDSLSAIERVTTTKSFREFVIGLTSFLEEKQIAGMFTATTPTLMGGTSITEQHISTITDSIILLRYVEVMGEMRRGLTVLKMRGSQHDKSIREFSIDEKGIHIGSAFHNVGGILSGVNTQIITEEKDKLAGMFEA